MLQPSAAGGTRGQAQGPVAGQLSCGSSAKAHGRAEHGTQVIGWAQAAWTGLDHSRSAIPNTAQECILALETLQPEHKGETPSRRAAFRAPAACPVT
jgi:hypothetical protein